jgi:predicted SAM-dependent methyltransferase
MFPCKGAYFADLRDPLELPDGSVRHIHCEHVLEHLERDEAQRFLGECRRILAADGSLRLILPDAEKYLRAYAGGDEAYFSAMRHLGNAVVPLRHRMAIINQMFRMGGGHRYAWDFEELSDALTEAGFANIRKSNMGDVATGLQIDGSDDWRAHESIYLNVSGVRQR